MAGPVSPVPPVPPDETERLQELLSYRILDTDPEAFYDDITNLAALACGTPMAVLTLIDSNRQWFKSKVGITAKEHPREIAFCAHTILGREMLVIADAHSDPRFSNNPLVTSEPKIRFYAGVPLVTPRGHALGTLAVLDKVPRDLAPDQRRALIALSKQVLAEFEARRGKSHGMEAFRAIVRACPLAIVGLDLEGRVFVWNQSAREMFGWDEAEVLGNRTPIVPPEEADSFRQVAATAREGLVLHNHEARRVRKDGTLIEVAISASPMRNEHGEVIGVMGVLDDITERKREHNDLERTVSLLRATLEATDDGIMAVDKQGRIILYNRRLAELWHAPIELLEAGDTSKVVQYAAAQLRDPEYFLEKIRRYVAGEHIEDSDVLQFKNGRLLERSSHPQFVSGERVGRVFSYRDITSRTQLEEQLRQAQKMEAIGQLAGGIAHDFNNLLNIIVGYTALLQDRLAGDENLRGPADQVMKAADRAAALTRQLLVFSRKHVLDRQVLDVNALVSNLSKMLPRLIGEDVELSINTSPSLGQILADAGQIEQVILNLVINARDAMPTGGKLTIETANVSLNRQYRVEDEGGSDYVTISVTDNGQGMSEEVKAHIFEPFFTTKQPGKGTGLGLATVYAIVHQSGGQIEVQSEIGKGSTFRVYFPTVEQAADRVTADIPLESTLSGKETILVIEDEVSLRELMCEILQRRGYNVLDASDGLEAIRLAQEHKGPIDLVISDIVMPGMRGWEATEQISRIQPHTRILYISGYADDAIVDRQLIGERAAFLQKPFTPDTLARKIREVLSGGAQAQASKDQ